MSHVPVQRFPGETRLAHWLAPGSTAVLPGQRFVGSAPYAWSESPLKRHKSQHALSGNINNQKGAIRKSLHRVEKAEKKLEKKIGNKIVGPHTSIVKTKGKKYKPSKVNISAEPVISRLSTGVVSHQSEKYQRTRVGKSEFISDIQSYVTWTNKIGQTPWLSNNSTGIGYSLNPGQATTFPWLSQLAACFEFYRFKSLVFEFRSSSGEVVSGSNPGLGMVDMCTNYDAKDDPFINKVQLEDYAGADSAPPYQRFFHRVMCKKTGTVNNLTKDFYVRSPTTSTSTTFDPSLYDMGYMQLAVSGCPAAGNKIGELWVHYVVDLIKPTPTNQSNSGMAHIFSNTVATATPLLNFGIRSGSTLAITSGPNNGSVFGVLNAKVGDVYHIISQSFSTASANAVPTVSVYTTNGCAATPLVTMINDTNSSFGNFASTGAFYSITFTVTAIDSVYNAATFNVAQSSASGNVTNDTFIYKWPPNLLTAPNPFGEAGGALINPTHRSYLSTTNLISFAAKLQSRLDSLESKIIKTWCDDGDDSKNCERYQQTDQSCLSLDQDSPVVLRPIDVPDLRGFIAPPSSRSNSRKKMNI